ncbi:MAG: DNA polymerase III subunit psi [Bacteroidetes bacterium]|nr:DNA polymerase III subunit psi [Bacteroidota bacterium]
MALENDSVSLLFENFYYINDDIPDEINLENKKIEIKRVLLVFDKLPDENNRILLEKILSAVKIRNDEVEIVLKSDYGKFIEQSFEVTVFWDDAEHENEKYNVVKNEKSTILKCDSLNKIGSNQQLKAKLWNCLKGIFL